MIIRRITARNFAGFKDLKLDLNADITHLVGDNGAGKTTIGETILWVAFKGIANKKGSFIGDRYQYIGEHGKSADVEITLYDKVRDTNISVKNHITKAGNAITFEAPDGYGLTKEWLSNLLNVAFMSATHFVSHTPKEQAILLGIDTKDFDRSIGEAAGDMTVSNRVVKMLGTRTPVEPAERVDVSSLMTELNKAGSFNNEQSVKSRAIQTQDELVTRLKQEEARLLEELRVLKNRIIEHSEAAMGLPQPLPVKDTSGIQEAVNTASETNDQAARYEEYVKWAEEKKAAEEKADADKKGLEKRRTDRVEYIKGFKFPFKGLSVDKDGGLLLNERRLATYSQGEREKYVAQMAVALDPVFRFRFVDNFESLDKKNQDSLIRFFEDNDIQGLTAEVSGDEDRNNVIVLRECEVVGRDAKISTGPELF